MGQFSFVSEVCINAQIIENDSCLKLAPKCDDLGVDEYALQQDLSNLEDSTTEGGSSGGNGSERKTTGATRCAGLDPRSCMVARQS